MTKSFTWERAPFETCPTCGMNTLGILMAGGNSLTMRCTNCRHTQLFPLPHLDKKVIYLDQNAFSVIFKHQAGARLPPGHEKFVARMTTLLRRVTLLQQAILPHSDIHHSETTVFHSANDLRAAYERIGGDARLKDTRVVERIQLAEFARAYIERREPQLSFSVDEVLASPRNRWLDDMHVHVNTDYKIFAEGIRERRGFLHQTLINLAETWRRERPTFDQLLRRELQALSERSQILQKIAGELEQAWQDEDHDLAFELANHPILREYALLVKLFKSAGVPDTDIARTILGFWNWSGNEMLPHHRIASFLYAALGSKVVAGMKKIGRGVSNDFRAIATYGPYVDAMFIDRECASYLEEMRVRQNLTLKARIFSFASGDRFLAYLEGLEKGVPDEVRAMAEKIYGAL